MWAGSIRKRPSTKSLQKSWVNTPNAAEIFLGLLSYHGMASINFYTFKRERRRPNLSD